METQIAKLSKEEIQKTIIELLQGYSYEEARRILYAAIRECADKSKIISVVE